MLLHTADWRTEFHCPKSVAVQSLKFSWYLVAQKCTRGGHQFGESLPIIVRTFPEAAQQAGSACPFV